MNTLELKMTFLQEVMNTNDETLIAKGLKNFRELCAKYHAQESTSLSVAENPALYQAPAKEEILSGIREALIEVKEAKKKGIKMQNANDWLNEL